MPPKFDKFDLERFKTAQNNMSAARVIPGSTKKVRGRNKGEPVSFYKCALIEMGYAKQEHCLDFEPESIFTNKKPLNDIRSWFIFPQCVGLSTSERGRTYAIKSREEAQAFLSDQLLASRLEEIAHQAYSSNRTIAQLFPGRHKDDRPKFHACLTLFNEILKSQPGGGWEHKLKQPRIFEDVLKHFFDGKPHEKTLGIMETWPSTGSKSPPKKNNKRRPSDTDAEDPAQKKLKTSKSPAKKQNTLSPAGTGSKSPAKKKNTPPPPSPGSKSPAKKQNTVPPAGTGSNSPAKKTNTPPSPNKASKSPPMKSSPRPKPGKGLNIPRKNNSSRPFKRRRHDYISLDRVRASRVDKQGRLQYWAQWANRPEDDGWWMAGDLKLAPLDLDDFHKAEPTADGPPIRIDIWRSAYFRGDLKEVAEHENDNTAWEKTW